MRLFVKSCDFSENCRTRTAKRRPSQKMRVACPASVSLARPTDPPSATALWHPRFVGGRHLNHLNCCSIRTVPQQRKNRYKLETVKYEKTQTEFILPVARPDHCCHASQVQLIVHSSRVPDLDQSLQLLVHSVRGVPPLPKTNANGRHRARGAVLPTRRQSCHFQQCA